MGRTPVSKQKFSVSSEAAGVPAAHPSIVLLPKISWAGVTSMRSGAAPITTSLPFGPRPSINAERGHLFLHDGVISDRRHFRLPRVGHGLKRLVIVSSDGFVSLSAFQWLADQRVAFAMLERDGKLLAATGLCDHRILDYVGLRHWPERMA